MGLNDWEALEYFTQKFIYLFPTICVYARNLPTIKKGEILSMLLIYFHGSRATNNQMGGESCTSFHAGQLVAVPIEVKLLPCVSVYRVGPWDNVEVKLLRHCVISHTLP